MVYKVQTQIDASLMTKHEIKFMINEPWRSVRNSRKNTTRKEPCNNFDTYVVLGSSSKSCVIVHFKLGTESNRYKSGNNKTVRRELQGIEPIERVLLSNQLHTVIQGHHKTIPNFFSDAEISNYIIFCAERLKKQVR